MLVPLVGTKNMTSALALFLPNHFYTACICELQSDSQRWRHHRNSGKRKRELQHFFQFKHFSLFSNTIGADFIQTNSKISFGNGILKKKFFSILKFCDQLLIHIKTKLFFFNKDGSRVKDKKNLQHRLEVVARKRHTVVKIFKNPPPFGAGRIKVKIGGLDPELMRFKYFLSFQLALLHILSVTSAFHRDVILFCFHIKKR